MAGRWERLTTGLLREGSDVKLIRTMRFRLLLQPVATAAAIFWVPGLWWARVQALFVQSFGDFNLQDASLDGKAMTLEWTVAGDWQTGTLIPVAPLLRSLHLLFGADDTRFALWAFAYPAGSEVPTEVPAKDGQGGGPQVGVKIDVPWLPLAIGLILTQNVCSVLGAWWRMAGRAWEPGLIFTGAHCSTTRACRAGWPFRAGTSTV